MDEKNNASGDAGLSADKAVAFEAANHLMDGRRAGTEVSLHVGFGGRLAKHALVDADIGQVATLLLGEAMGGAAALGA